MTKLVLLAIVVVVAAPFIRGFARWERKEMVLRITMILLVLELIEAALYDDQNLIPRGLFHPGSGSTQLRLPELFIALALIGRLVAKRLPKGIGYPAMLWVAFGFWMVVEVVEGYLRGNVHSQALYEGKAAIYILGGFALAAAVPARQYLDARVFERLTRWLAPLALVLDVMSSGHSSYAIRVPFLPVPAFGVVGADVATMFPVVGVIALMLELGKQRRSLWTLASTIPLLLSSVIASQRAALVGLGASLAFVLVICLGPSARRRIRVNGCEIALAALAVFALLVAVVLVPAAVRQEAPRIPFSTTLNTEFSSTGKAESAQDRINELQAARRMIPRELLFGWGLGLEYSYWSPGPNVEVTSALTEDVYLDLWLRTGLVGAGLFILALLVSLGDGLKVWRHHQDRMVSLFAAALVAVIFGILVKGGFESILEKYRLATMLGLLLGMLRSTVTSAGGTWSSSSAALGELRIDEKV
jgi:O-antigen ligase